QRGARNAGAGLHGVGHQLLRVSGAADKGLDRHARVRDGRTGHDLAEFGRHGPAPALHGGRHDQRHSVSTKSTKNGMASPRAMPFLFSVEFSNQSAALAIIPT